ncbi:MAG: TolC family protein [Desulfobulbaceae bacterium]|nr:MAG: TolC family protein [Desulfobulbaceae bacterium]
MNLYHKTIVLSSFALTILLSGCTGKLAPVAEQTIPLPPSFSTAGTENLEEKWWLAFDDEALNQLIEQSLNDNFSLKSSWSRLAQASAAYKKANASLLPSLSADGSNSHSAAQNDGKTTTNDQLTLGLTLSYELDLWGKVDSTSAASRLDMEATTADLETAAISLSAEIATAWYSLIEINSSLSLLEEQITTNTKALELITTQFRTGQAPIADILQQRQLIEQQRGEQARLRSQQGQTEHTLALLAGEMVGVLEIDPPDHLIELPPLPDTGLPAELIKSRPDIRSAFLSLQAADERVAAAVADQYPSIRLSASLQTEESRTSVLFSDYLASLVTSITAPLLDGGQRKAEVERTRAVAEEKLHNYAQTVITAVKEVEDALLIEQQQQQYLDSLELQLELSKQSLEQIKERYLKGVESYERVLTALTSLQSLQQSLLEARKDLLHNRIELCRALGSGWNYSQTKQQT